MWCCGGGSFEVAGWRRQLCGGSLAAAALRLQLGGNSLAATAWRQHGGGGSAVEALSARVVAAWRRQCSAVAALSVMAGWCEPDQLIKNTVKKNYCKEYCICTPNKFV